MGCCQDKDLQNGQKATRSQSADGEEEGAKEKAAGGMSLGGPQVGAPQPGSQSGVVCALERSSGLPLRRR